MTTSEIKKNLPADYFRGKDGAGYRFTILKDVATAGESPSSLYEGGQEDQIIDYYRGRQDFALYVHFPWCIERCSYCHYYRGPILKRDLLQKMLEAEKAHARFMDDRLGLRERNVGSIYFGGGTPTVVPAAMLDETLDYFVSGYKGDDTREVCLECSVITLKPKKVEILERYINRLSIGVQAFDDSILKIMERKHTAEEAEQTVRDMIPRFDSVNVDLIYGLHDQNLKTWLHSVEKGIELGAPSLTLYRLDIREIPSIIKIFRDDPGRFPTELQCWEMYEEARRLLLASGYREELIGWFLLPKVKETRVYQERWQKQTPCIAFGPALHNYGADHFYETLAGHDEYVAAVEGGQLPIKHVYRMGPRKQLAWYVMARLKSDKPVLKSVLIDRFGEELHDELMTLSGKYIQWGVLEDTGDEVRLTEGGHYLLEWFLLEVVAWL